MTSGLVQLSGAATNIIAQRTAIMLSTAGRPSALQHPELTRMVREKVEAYPAAWGAYLGGLAVLSGLWAGAAAGWVGAGAQAWTAMTFAGPWVNWPSIHHRWSQTVLADSRKTAGQMSLATAELTNAALAPVLRVARANARRLGAERPK